MNPLRHDFITECLSTDPSNTISKKYEYLDIGCGGGIFAESAARRPHTSSVTAIDPTPEVIAIAREHARNDPSLSPPKLTYINTSIENLSTHLPPSPSSSPPHQFDIITLFEVLEHITHPSPFLTHILSTHLKPGGWFICSTISRHPMSFLTTKLIAEMPVFGLVPPGTHTWSQYIKPEELQNWFYEREENKGTFEAGRCKGVMYVPGVGWKWTPEGWGLEGWGNYFWGVKKVG
ncbi:putative hexaprenyldihydroxybenzoate mitochondrial precursor [Phaeomoniella chlamydospora]|uniref:Putative hexaprenyldihydroxybenzoate mitochondrial n=1 Tax=Phaeomoniella chlamydospora TaxID=158046 RepID=A0A0G2F286_PHACM|nr:putative hexaprenyldihydroxybenzoate mitochondrial precursor [Phaeomoniella chlamydospora]